MLQSRKSRHEEPLSIHVPDPIVSVEADTDPEQEALLADSVGLALEVVLDTLAPAERLAFVLHDMFGVPFDEIAPIVGRSEAASRQLASRARRRVRGAPAVPDTDLARQREVVDAFMRAAREGNFDALLEVLDPDVVLRVDGGTLAATGSREVRGARAVAGLALGYSRLGLVVHRALVNGGAGLDAGRTAVRRRRLHHREREDRGDRHPGGPGAPVPARPSVPGRLTANDDERRGPCACSLRERPVRSGPGSSPSWSHGATR
jgi:RNA polymerase sigma-70 factor, ECF subfamily